MLALICFTELFKHVLANISNPMTFLGQRHIATVDLSMVSCATDDQIL